MDGHSAKWGFSKGDMLANIAGCVLFEGQQLLWHEQRISLKYSYHGTSSRSITRPNWAATCHKGC
jgi:hypothetical protein